MLLTGRNVFFGVKCSNTVPCFTNQVHTPDSSRYWLAASYERRFQAGEEPANVDKVVNESNTNMFLLVYFYFFLPN